MRRESGDTGKTGGNTSVSRHSNRLFSGQQGISQRSVARLDWTIMVQCYQAVPYNPDLIWTDILSILKTIPLQA